MFVITIFRQSVFETILSTRRGKCQNSDLFASSSNYWSINTFLSVFMQEQQWENMKKPENNISITKFLPYPPLKEFVFMVSVYLSGRSLIPDYFSTREDFPEFVSMKEKIKITSILINYSTYCLSKTKIMYDFLLLFVQSELLTCLKMQGRGVKLPPGYQ